MNIESPENIQSPEARKAYNLFRKEEKVRESATAWTEYNSQKTGALQQLKRLRDELRFSSAAELAAQIEKDVVETRKALGL